MTDDGLYCLECRLSNPKGKQAGRSIFSTHTTENEALETSQRTEKQYPSKGENEGCILIYGDYALK